MGLKMEVSERVESDFQTYVVPPDATNCTDCPWHIFGGPEIRIWGGGKMVTSFTMVSVLKQFFTKSFTLYFRGVENVWDGLSRVEVVPSSKSQYRLSGLPERH